MRKGSRNKAVTLYSPDGRQYTTSDKVEATNLKMRGGYTDKPPAKKRTPPKKEDPDPPASES